MSLSDLGTSPKYVGFNASYPEGHHPRRTGRILFQKEWRAGCLNDLLRSHLTQRALPYFNTMSGRIWFSYGGGHWFSAEFEVTGNIATAFELS